MVILSTQNIEKDLGRASKDEVERVLTELEDTKRMMPTDGWHFYLAHPNMKSQLLFFICSELQKMSFSFFLEPRRFHAAADASLAATLGEMAEILDRCNSYLFLAQSPDDDSPYLRWQCGYMEGRKRYVGVLPFSKKDTLEDEFKGHGWLRAYPFAAAGKTLDDGRETLWMMQDAKHYVNLEYWMHRGF